MHCHLWSVYSIFCITSRESLRIKMKHLHHGQSHDIDGPMRQDLSPLHPGQLDGLTPINPLDTSNMRQSVFLLHPASPRVVRIIWDGVVAPESYWQGDDATEYKEPSPPRETQTTVQIAIDGCLEVAAEHTRRVACRIKDGNALCQLTLCIPAAHDREYSDSKGSLAHSDQPSQCKDLLHAVHGGEAECDD